jgi:hypothetical protein
MKAMHTNDIYDEVLEMINNNCSKLIDRIALNHVYTECVHRLYPHGIKNVQINNSLDKTTVSFPENSMVHNAFLLSTYFKQFPCGLLSKLNWENAIYTSDNDAKFTLELVLVPNVEKVVMNFISNEFLVDFNSMVHCNINKIYFRYFNTSTREYYYIAPFENEYLSGILELNGTYIGTRHSYDDYPSFIDDSNVMWYNNGYLHRDGNNFAHIEYDLICCNKYTTVSYFKMGVRTRNDGLPCVYHIKENRYTNTLMYISFTYLYNGLTNFFPLFYQLYPSNSYISIDDDDERTLSCFPEMAEIFNNEDLQNLIHGISWFAFPKQVIKTIEELDEDGKVIKIRKVECTLPILQFDLLGIVLNFLQSDIPAFFLARLIQLNVESLLKFK